MTDAIDDTEEALETDEPVLEDDEELADLEPSEDDLAEATVPPAGAAEVESIQDLLAKQETASEAAEAADEEDEAAVALSARDERLEPAETRVVPMQATEFMCKRCYLVKHRSQLADKKKMLCRDCA
jgi:hypothetical protein